MTPNNKFLLSVIIGGIIIFLVSKILPIISASTGGINIQIILQALFLIIILWFIAKGLSKLHKSSYLAILTWFLIFTLLIITYAFRFELDSAKHKVLSVLIPSYNWSDENGQLVIARHQNGHFYIDAKTAHNKKIKFLIDTGASDIALTKEAAIKLGFDLKKLSYTKAYNTANGISYSAPVKIKQLTIGEKTFYNLSANVTSGGLDISLLGMSLIDDFRNFKINNDLLILQY